MKYSIHISTSAQKQFTKLPYNIQSRIRDKILTLESNPRPFGIKRLSNTQYHRLRTGDYRAIYSIDDDHKIVTILDIAHRREVYR